MALAAGQISGIVRNDNRVMLVKGGTHKAKAISKEYEERADGSIAETTIAIDKFVPLIKAIDFTPGADYGKV
ncbi:class I SAM-dependent methyltransferase, partial [Citrobacter braakii]|nr:class I SAM-dependent methyltransferase [Citrobacter braakii]